jgi:hypothetical protein
MYIFLNSGELIVKTKKQSQKQVPTQLQVYLPIVTLTDKDMSSVNGGAQINAI